MGIAEKITQGGVKRYQHGKHRQQDNMCQIDFECSVNMYQKSSKNKGRWGVQVLGEPSVKKMHKTQTS